MIDSKLSALILSVLTVPVLILSIACGGEEDGLSRAEVEEIVRAGLAESPAPSTAEPGLTSADVEKAIHAAMADMPQPESGLSKSEVEEIVKAAVAAILTFPPETVSVAKRVHTERPELPTMATLAWITEQPPTQTRYCVRST